jgi:hypothetical protein
MGREDEVMIVSVKIPKRLTKKWTRTFSGMTYTTIGSANTEKRAEGMADEVRKKGFHARVTAVRVPDPNGGRGTHVSYITWMGPKMKRGGKK